MYVVAYETQVQEGYNVFFQQCGFPHVCNRRLIVISYTRCNLFFTNVKLVRVSPHKPVTAGHYVIVTWRTVSHVCACFKAVCSTMKNHVIIPCIICHEACEVAISR